MPSIGDYVGLPFAPRGRTREGVDCWGLVVLVYRQILWLDLPSYDDRYTTLDSAERVDRAAIIAGERGAWYEVEAPQAFDVVLFTLGELAAHVGLVVDDGRMLHIQRGACSVIERYDTPKWQPRLAGCFRHA